MHNWEHYNRLPAYLLMAALVASCGGGSDDTLIGQSSDKIEVVSTVSSGVVTAPIDGAAVVTVKASRDGAPVKQQTVTVSLVSGEAGLLLDGMTEPVKTLQVKTDDNGNVTFKLRGLAKNSTGQIVASYIDSSNKETAKTIPYQVGENLNVVYDLSLTPASGSDNSIATVGADSVVAIVATLKDKAGNAVVGQTVQFETTRGTLSKAAAITNASGQATVQLSGVGAVAGAGTITSSYIDADGNKASNQMSFEVVNDYKLTLTTDNNEIPTGTSDIVLTAFILDGTGTTVSSTAGVKARFEVVSGGGALSNVSAINDGIVTAKYTLPKDAKNQTVKLRAVLSGSGISTTNPPTGTIDLNLSGTSVVLSSNKASVSEGDQIEFSMILKNGKGVGLPSQKLNLAATGLVLSNSVITTGADGSAKVSAKVQTNGASTATATVSLDDADLDVDSSSLTLAVSQLSFDVKPPAVSSLLINTNYTMTVTLKDSTPVNGRKVKVSSTLGTINGTNNPAIPTLTIVDPNPTDADNTGTVTFTLNSAFPGESLVEAIAQSSATASSPYSLKTARFVNLVSTVPDPDKFHIQAEKTNLSPNEPTVITAKVLDAKDNPVEGIDVAFKRDKDPSNGLLSSSVVQTDKNGQAKVTYTAGPLTTGSGAVEISAHISPDPAVPPVQKLTVGGKALFVSIGTGNVISVLDGHENTTYSLPHQVVVTDSTGAPSANTDVVLSIVPTAYIKGYYNLGKNADGAVDSEYTVNQVAKCVSEDANQNGILDAKENNGSGSNVFGATDVIDNKDGILWPGNPITLSAKSVRTDDQGVANFDVIYAKSYANWLSAKVVATASVAGTESKAERTFNTVAAKEDLASSKNPPGGFDSPFGRVKSGDENLISSIGCTYVYYPQDN